MRGGGNWEGEDACLPVTQEVDGKPPALTDGGVINVIESGRVEGAGPSV